MAETKQKSQQSKPSTTKKETQSPQRHDMPQQRHETEKHEQFGKEKNEFNKEEEKNPHRTGHGKPEQMKSGQQQKGAQQAQKDTSGNCGCG